MDSEKPTEESTILAAKYKTAYAIHRFLSSVLLEFSLKLLENNVSEKPKKSKTSLDPQIKKAISNEVRRQLSSKNANRKVDSKRKKNHNNIKLLCGYGDSIPSKKTIRDIIRQTSQKLIKMLKNHVTK